MVSLEHDLVLVSNLSTVRLFYIKIILSKTFKAVIKQAASWHYHPQNDKINVKMENYYDLSLIIRTIKSSGEISPPPLSLSEKLKITVGSKLVVKEAANYIKSPIIPIITLKISPTTPRPMPLYYHWLGLLADGLITCWVFINAGMFEYNNSCSINWAYFDSIHLSVVLIRLCV